MYYPNQAGNRSQPRYNDQYRRHNNSAVRPNNNIALDESFDRRYSDYNKGQQDLQRHKYYKRYDSRESRRNEFLDRHYGPDRRYDFERDYEDSRNRRKRRHKEKRRREYHGRDRDVYRDRTPYSEPEYYRDRNYVDEPRHIAYSDRPPYPIPQEMPPPRTEGVKYEPQPEVNYFTPPDQNKSKTRVAYFLLISVLVLLVCALTIGIVSTIMEPWWTHDKADGKTHVKIGLWKSCYKKIDDYICKSYEDTGNAQTNEDTPYSNMDVLQYCMITGDIVSGLSLILLIVAIIIRKKNPFRVVMYCVLFLTLSAVALYVVVIGFALEVKLTDEIIPAWIINDLTTAERKEEVDKSTFLILACVCAGVAGLAMILVGVFLFIDDDPEIYENEGEENRGHERSDSFHYDQRSEIKKSQESDNPHAIRLENETYFMSNPTPGQVPYRPPETQVPYRPPEFYEYGKEQYRDEDLRPQSKIKRPNIRSGVTSDASFDELDTRDMEDRTEHYNKYRNKELKAQTRDQPEVFLVSQANRPMNSKSVPVLANDNRLISGTSKHPDYPDSFPPPIGSAAQRNQRFNQPMERARSPASLSQYEMYFNSPY